MFQSTHLHEVWPIGAFAQNANTQFQSTHLHEVWHTDSWSLKAAVKFQSTHLHEVWLIILIGLLFSMSFNTHTYMRCDVLNKPCAESYFCFNPHTYMRCDFGFLLTSPAGIGFQSTHLHEVWLIVPNKYHSYNMFQSTHLHEVWLTSTWTPLLN